MVMSQNYFCTISINSSRDKGVYACRCIMQQWLQNNMSDNTGDEGPNVMDVFLDGDKSASQSGNLDKDGTDADISG